MFMSAYSHLLRAPGKSLLMTLLCLVLGNTAHAAENAMFRVLAADSATLDAYRWKKRPVILFAASQQDAKYIEQVRMLKQQQPALEERDIIVLTDTSPDTKSTLRSQLKPEGFEIVLVGKDGGIKLRETSPLSAEVLLSTIDRMPMRKAGQN